MYGPCEGNQLFTLWTFLDMEHGLFLMTDVLCVSKCRQGYKHEDDNTEATT